VAFTPDGRTLLTACEGVYFWDAATGHPLGRLPVTQFIWSLALAPDGKVLATADQSGPVRLWEVAMRREIARLPNGFRVAFAPDGRLLAIGTKGTVKLWDCATCATCKVLEGHNDRIDALAFAPDGTMLLSSGGETSALTWDVADVVNRPMVKSRNPGPELLQRWWQDLAAEDAAAAYKAQWKLAAAAEQALPVLQASLRRADHGQVERIVSRIAELDDDRFEVREKAADDLQKLGALAQTQLQHALPHAASVEQRRRLEELVKKLPELSGSQGLRELRAVAVLERIGSPAARALLQDLAGGHPGSELTREAKASLRRLAQRALPRSDTTSAIRP
jgi:hypothetical protein